MYNNVENSKRFPTTRNRCVSGTIEQIPNVRRPRSVVFTETAYHANFQRYFKTGLINRGLSKKVLITNNICKYSS